MAVLDGAMMQLASGSSGGRITPDIAVYSMLFSPNAHLVQATPAGTPNRTVAAAITRGIDGVKMRSYVDDYYYRIHIVPNPLNFGNIITTLQQDFIVWNAYLSEKTLSSTALTDGDSLTISAPVSAPYVMQPLRYLTYSVTAGLTGSLILDATYSVTIGGETLDLSIIGQRIVAWTFRPDWAAGILERLEWKTDITEAYDSSEQRISLRQTPRRFLEFDYWIEDAATRRRFEALLWSWGGYQWAVPIWTDSRALMATLASGSTSIPITTTNLDYQAGGLVIIMTGPMSFEAATIDSVAPGSITLKLPLAQSWPAGSVVMPMRLGYLEDRTKLQRFTGDTLRGTARFQFADISSCTAATETTYRGYPILTTAPIWTRDLFIDYMRKRSEIDFGIGGIAIEDEAGMPATLQSHHWTIDGKAAIEAFRSFLYARRGRLKALWVPSFLIDLVSVTTISSASTAIDVEHCFYTRHLSMDPNRKDVRIELVNGTVLYRRINSAVELDASTERLGIDSALGVTVTPSEITRISFMAFARFDSDGVELAWSHDDLVEVTANWRAVRHDA